MTRLLSLLGLLVLLAAPSSTASAHTRMSAVSGACAAL